MSQHDYNIANGGGAAVRSDINSALGAIQSLNSGTTAPTTTVAGMLWYDTLTGSLKQRNAGNTAWVSAAELMGGGPLAGMRNRIMNGKMDVAQRGTSFAGISSGQYTVDRFVAGVSGTAAVTVTQQADVPSSNEFLYSLRYAVTTSDTSIAAGDFGRLAQSIEGSNARDLIGRTFTLSFWVRSSKTGVHCVGLTNNGGDRSYVAEYTISAANAWEYKTVTVSGGLITSGTWDWTTGTGLRISWAIAAGSTFQTSAGAWQTGNFFATSNQVNCLDTIGNIFSITGVQLEPGGVATPFEQRPYGMELALCQRYFQIANGGSGSAISTTLANVRVTYPQMRVSPTLTNSSFGFVYGSTGTTLTVTAVSDTIAGSYWAIWQTTVASGLTAGNGTTYYNGTHLLSAEL